MTAAAAATLIKHPSMPEDFGSRGKLSARHLKRKAVVYVRQSSVSQVRNNQESGRLQYALVERVMALGFRREQVEIIDEDQGQSGTSREGRSGFERLLELVNGLKVGLIMSLEVSRLARSSIDWQLLVRCCQYSGTLVGEQEGLYNPSDANDRLFLGIKGAMSEFEIALLLQRMDQGKRAKAVRGELSFTPPTGYVVSEQGRLLKDPDSSVTTRIELVFSLFERLGSVRQVLKALQAEGLMLPQRQSSRLGRGVLQWKEPSSTALLRMLKNPLYSGAYVWGRRHSDSRLRKAGQPYSGIRTLPPEQWLVHLPEQHPAYISFEQYEFNVQTLANNAPQGLGAPRGGPSLLAGLLKCARCGSSMQVSYSNNGAGLRYSCIAADLRRGQGRCQSLVGEVLEQAVEEQVLAALGPAALELSIAALEKLEAHTMPLELCWQQRLEQARYRVDLARRRYEAADPQYRLATAELEREWNEALLEREKLEQDYERFRSQRALELDEQKRAELLALASDIPALWKASSTTAQQRQSIARLLLERVEELVEEQSERLSLTLCWAGGDVSILELRRPVARPEQLSFYPQLLQELKALWLEGLKDRGIAERFNAEGWHSARGRPWSGSSVSALRRRMGWTA
jgi:DNA invertase Pin-like site-specific DNA recombinase